MKREKWIDNAKGIAMLLVIIEHTGGGMEGIWQFKRMLGLPLAVFFLLSGYTMKRKEVTGDFVNKKFTQMMIPYFYTCLAVMVMDLFNSFYLKQDLSVLTMTGIVKNDLLRSFFASGNIKNFGNIELGTRIGAIWFFPAIFFAILIFQLLLNKTEDDRILGASTALIAMAGYLTARFLWLPFSIQAAMFASFFLWIGYEVRKHSLLQKIRWFHFVIAQIVFLLGVYLGYSGVGFVTASFKDALLSIPVVLAGCLMVYLVAKADSRGIVLSYIGRITLSMLCVHLFALNTLKPYFRKILDGLSLKGNTRVWCFIAINIVFVLAMSILIEKYKTVRIPLRNRLIAFAQQTKEKSRDTAADIAKGILICLMLIATYKIDEGLRITIVSCCAAAFVFFSGYFYQKERSFGATLKRMLGSLLVPYAMFIVLAFVVNGPSWSPDQFRQNGYRYLLGLSAKSELFPDIKAAGVVSFVLLLFVIRLVYTLLRKKIRNGRTLAFLVICISVFGTQMGKWKWGLPWSIDVACYALIFYYIGALFREYDLLTESNRRNILYFVFSPMLVYMIYTGGMDMKTREYGKYGIAILGAVCGILLIGKLSAFLDEKLPVSAMVFRTIGRHTMMLLILHTLFSGRIQSFIGRRFDKAYLPAMVFCIATEVILAVIAGALFGYLRKQGSRLFVKAV